MISEGSCNTEEWSNDAENSALPSQEMVKQTYIIQPWYYATALFTCLI